MTSINILGILVLIFSSHPIALMSGTFLFAALFPIGNIELPLLSRHFFGRADGNQIFPLVNFFQSTAGAISVSIVGYSYDFTGTYLVAFGAAIALQIISLTALYAGTYWRSKKEET